MYRKISVLITLVVAMVMASAAIGPVAAQSKRQKDKNNMRNLGTGLGAAAAWEALHGKTTNAVVLGAGAAYSGKKYEDARKAQRREGTRYRHRTRTSSRSHRAHRRRAHQA